MTTVITENYNATRVAALVAQFGAAQLMEIELNETTGRKLGPLHFEIERDGAIDIIQKSCVSIGEGFRNTLDNKAATIDLLRAFAILPSPTESQ